MALSVRERAHAAIEKAETTSNPYQRIVPFIIFVLALILLFFLVRPMISVLLGAFLLAYISFPLYRRIRYRITNKFFSIVAALVIVCIIALIPLGFLVFEIVREGYHFYDSLSSSIVDGALFGFGCTSAESQLCAVMNQVETFSAQWLSSWGLDTQLQKLLPLFEARLALIIIGIPIVIAKIFLGIIMAYFIINDWENIRNQIVALLPMRPATITRLFEEFNSISYTVIYAQLFIAAIQGIIGMIGFYVFGIPFPIFFGVVMAFFALIPTIGTAIIWLPASAFLIITGYFAGDMITMWKGIGLFVYGAAIISVIDNILLAKLVHAKAKVSQILVIVGVIGGASLFGVVGIFVGPILLPLLVTYFQTFKERFT